MDVFFTLSDLCTLNLNDVNECQNWKWPVSAMKYLA